jgi:hypothetical protein
LVGTYTSAKEKIVFFRFQAGLPDGLFSNQKIPIWVNFGGSSNGMLVYFMAIWSILGPFDIFCDH